MGGSKVREKIAIAEAISAYSLRSFLRATFVNSLTTWTLMQAPSTINRFAIKQCQSAGIVA
jgi:hypothetical protein